MIMMVWRLKERIAAEQEHLTRLQDRRARLSAELTGMPKKGASSSKVEELTVSIMDSTRAVVELQDIQTRVQSELLDLIDGLPMRGKYKSVLIERYVYCASFREVSERLGLKERRMYQIHRQAIDIYEQNLN